MLSKLLQRLRRKKNPIFVDQRERDALIRENAEALGESLEQANRDDSLGGRFIDQVTAPGVVGDPTLLITKKVAEQRARNNRPN